MTQETQADSVYEITFDEIREPLADFIEGAVKGINALQEAVEGLEDVVNINAEESNKLYARVEALEERVQTFIGAQQLTNKFSHNISRGLRAGLGEAFDQIDELREKPTVWQRVKGWLGVGS